MLEWWLCSSERKENYNADDKVDGFLLKSLMLDDYHPHNYHHFHNREMNNSRKS